MGFYDLDKEARQKLVCKIETEVLADIKAGKAGNLESYAADSDTYIRKAVYQAIANLYNNEKSLKPKILARL